jgi:hypothetical protein
MNAVLAALRARLSPPPARRILVAALLEPGIVVLNIGTEAGAHLGQRFELRDEGIPITYEGEYLGTHYRPGVVVSVTEAQERLVVARMVQPARDPEPWDWTRPRRTVLPAWVAIRTQAVQLAD